MRDYRLSDGESLSPNKVPDSDSILRRDEYVIYLTVLGKVSYEVDPKPNINKSHNYFCPECRNFIDKNHYLRKDNHIQKNKTYDQK